MIRGTGGCVVVVFDGAVVVTEAVVGTVGSVTGMVNVDAVPAPPEHDTATSAMTTPSIDLAHILAPPYRPSHEPRRYGSTVGASIGSIRARPFTVSKPDWEGLFCGAFGVEKALAAYYLFYFWLLIRKVMAPEPLPVAAATTGNAFARSVAEQGWASAEVADCANAVLTDAGKVLPRSARVSRLLFEMMDRAPLNREDNLEFHEGTPAIITRIEPERLWFDGLGPVEVSAEASDLADIGRQVTMTLGRTRREWVIVEIDNVYPRPLPGPG